MTPFVADPDFTLFVGNAVDALRDLPDESVHCVVTSPPYWGLRDYGTGSWAGGDPDCDHKQRNARNDPDRDTRHTDGRNPETQGLVGVQDAIQFSDVCGKCGATRTDQQLGLEATPDEYVARMVDVFREVRRVLRRDGTCWLNIGDSYASGEVGRVDAPAKNVLLAETQKPRAERRITQRSGLKPKDLVGIPWRVAFALQQPYYVGNIPDENDRTWLAAIIDGEGSIALNYLKPTETNARNHDYYGPYLRVHNTNEAIVRRCAEITGVGSVRVHDSRRRHVFVWAVYGETARQILREVYPYLVAKQHEARLAFHSPGEANCYAGLKLLHKGSDTTVDRPAPPSCHEPGWYLRSDIIWAKPNPMPESVTDRPTKAHEYLFLLTRSARYFYDTDAIREPYTYGDDGRLAFTGQTGDNGRRGASAKGPDGRRVTAVIGKDGSEQHRNGERWPNLAGRNARSVWEIATQPYAEAHFATFPEELPRRCIAAGTSERGCCATCGAPWERETESVGQRSTHGVNRAADAARAHEPLRDNGTRHGTTSVLSTGSVSVRATTGWNPACGHESPLVPCTVLDPFMGSGTVALVARKLGRRSIGIELNPDYAELAARRLSQLSLLAEEGIA